MKKILFSAALCLLVSIVFLFSSCNKDDDQAKTDDALIQQYLADHNLQADKTSSGLYYIINVPGNNQHPILADNVHIAYTGSLLNGNVFDSSLSSTFPLDNLIEGMKEGILLFGKGGEGKLIMPSTLGYGKSAKQGIPANSVLIFDITLIGF
ncbi:MAG: FKBP-type peptidyl-prolyl cis-trans isomerase [Saprospiraceae bacterium]